MNRRYLLVGALALGGLSACSPQPMLAGADADPGGVAAPPPYRLGPGDRVRVITFGEESLTGEFIVSGTGKIALPLVGNVDAAGLTLTEFQDGVVRALKDGYLRDPRVSAEVLNYRPFYILGEVNKPGEYPYSADLTVVNAVARAEGFTYRADSRRVFIKRAGESAEREYPLTTTVVVAPGDTIRVAERSF